MQFQYHTDITLGALRRWLIVQCYDELAIGGLWLAAMLWLRVPWAPFWALTVAVLQSSLRLKAVREKTRKMAAVTSALATQRAGY